jgi:hypothetical protein
VSREQAGIVRKPLRVAERSSRALDQRLLLQFPGLTAAYLRVIDRLSPHSRLRQAAVWRGVRLGSEAYNRRDLDAAVVGWDPEFEYHPGRDWVEAGLVEPCYRGVEGYRRYVAIADEISGGELYLQAMELIDLGNRLLILADAPIRGQEGDVSRSDPYAALTTLKDGRVIKTQEYFDHADALGAAGLQE